MGKLGAFIINFSNPDRVYSPGGMLTGYVIVHLNERMKMRGILISFKGNGHVKFEERRSKHNRTYKANEDYFDQSYTLFKPDGEEGYLAQGEHRFDFSFQLPAFLPGTFEGKFGYVRYYAKCRIDRPWKFDHVVKEAFNVLALLDLNGEQDVDLPQRLEHSDKSYNCCCMEDGDAKLKLDLPRTGFVPGESIPVTAVLDSSVPESLTFTVELIQYIQYKTSSKSKEVREVVSELESVNVNPRQNYYYSGQPLHIPAIPPSRLDGCDIIDVQYALKLKATTGFFEVKVKSDIRIGTIPLRSVVDTYRTPPMLDMNAVQLEPSAPPPSFSAAEALPRGSFPQPPPSTTDFEMPPPTYEECVFGATNIRDDEDTAHTFGSASYSPRYTYYKWT